MSQDPRRSIARLAAAVLVADGRITSTEIASLPSLVRLGLGALEEPIREALARARQVPIDVGTVCDELGRAYPEACVPVLAALAEIAVSDGELVESEAALLATIAERLGVDAALARQIVRRAVEVAGVVDIGTRGAAPAAAPAANVEPAAPRTRETASAPRASRDPGLGTAYTILGLDPGAPPDAVERAYRAAIERYQPARVVELGLDFAVLAVRHLAATPAAFSALTASAEGHSPRRRDSSREMLLSESAAVDHDR
jgi:uncharacterized tellurite resistance protein B-like protein